MVERFLKKVFADMRARAVFLSLSLVILAALAASGCSRPARTPEGAGEEPIVLEQGSTADEPDYFVNEDGEVIYRDSRTTLESESEGEQSANLPPVFPGAQRIYPSGDDPHLRRSYLTRAPFEAVSRFYEVWLARGDAPDQADEAEEDGEETIVNSITSVEDGRRQTTFFVNDGDGPRGGMKVILQEYPAQHTVQIVLTTLSATPVGLNPIGTYVTPEEVQQWADESGEDDSGEEGKEEGE
jgi:hypothetical protein